MSKTKCEKCNSEKTEFLSSVGEYEEGKLCWFICLDCNEMFIDIEKLEK